MKKILRPLLLEGRLGEVADLAQKRRRTLGVLVSLTFDEDPLVGWRAVEAMGLATSLIADDDPQPVINHLRRLHWLLSEESGGLCWMAPQAMAEIVRHRPDLFADFIPIVVHLLLDMADEDLEGFRAAILWAVGRLGSLAEDHVDALRPAIVSSLDDPDPQVRGTAAWCLEQIRQGDLLEDRPDLLDDKGWTDLYEKGTLDRTKVAALARRALSSARKALPKR